MIGAQSLGKHPILAVIVLYQCEADSSQSFSSLQRVFAEEPALRTHFSVVVYDNSPQALSGPIPAHYFHDPSNGGLATAYNFALERAENEQCEWLLLLDQDTSLTREFIEELLDATEKFRNDANLGMIIPKLAVNGTVHSPATPFLQQMRQQFQPPIPPIPRDFVGILQQAMCPYNSGSTLRVTALRNIGGFPREFWLDFLDHAIYEALFARGYRAYLLRATLEHEASYSDLEKMPLWRLQNVLAAETLFVKQRGNIRDKLLFRIWLLRYARTLRRACTNPKIWRQAVLQALLFREPRGFNGRE